jgi:hypothetical protein
MTSSTSYSLGGVDRCVNIVSAEVEAVTTWWWSSSSSVWGQAEHLNGRRHYDHRGDGRAAAQWP